MTNDELIEALYPSGLTDADWAEINKLRRARETGHDGVSHPVNPQGHVNIFTAHFARPDRCASAACATVTVSS
jgi:hypothetical protein